MDSALLLELLGVLVRHLPEDFAEQRGLRREADKLLEQLTLSISGVIEHHSISGLKECPLCGYDPQLVAEPDSNRVYIYCTHCQYRHPNFKNTERDVAIASWNARRR